MMKSSPNPSSKGLSGPFAALAVLILAFSCTPARAQIDNINGNATPPYLVWSTDFNTEGWEYTPTKSYTLTGISSDFEPVTDGSGLKTVTVQIQTAPDGGTVIDQGTFSVDSDTGGLQGATFPTSALLTAGTTYFVDLEGIGGLGVNVGQWADTGPGNTPAPSDGATVNLDAFWTYDGGTSAWVEGVPDVPGAYDTDSGYNLSIDEPILAFFGTALPVPESSSWAMLLGGLGLLAIFRLRSSRA